MKHEQPPLLARLLLFVAAALPMAAPTWTATDPARGAALESKRLLFLLEYIGADYGAAVEDGAIINAFEYQEMTSFSGILVEQFDVLRRHGASEEVKGELLRLQEMIRNLRPWSEILALVGELTTTLFEELLIVSYPAETPNLPRGERLFLDNCAACHGPSGGGDGFAAPGQEPPATSFQDARMNLLSPHQIYGAITFGIDGTAMPSYLGAMQPQWLWDIAFHVLTLRSGFDPDPRGPELPLTLQDLVSYSNDRLVERLAAEGLAAEVRDIDYFRRHPPEFRLPADVLASAPSNRPTAAGTPEDFAEDSAIRLAEQLQDAFTRVADEVLPSVVSVTSYVRHEGSPPEEKDEAWEIAGDEARLYPGFRRLRSGSGFFVTEDGYLLSCHHIVTRPDGETAGVIDVELANGRHILSRLVGAEPTINLAVLKLEIVSEHRPPRIRPVKIGDSDGVRVGHWSIAVGDPWGPSRTYAVGTLAAQPQRQCYQEQLTGTLMQSALSIHPESYGGPLLDIHGRVVGMTVPPPGEVGLGLDFTTRPSEFALPINLAMNIYQALKCGGEPNAPPGSASRCWTWPPYPPARRAIVLGRAPGRCRAPGSTSTTCSSPARPPRAGIRVGDCLVSIDGNRLFSVLDFQKWLYLSGIGRTVRLEIFRDQKTLEKKVKIEERPASATTR